MGSMSQHAPHADGAPSSAEHRPYAGLRLMHVHAHPDDESSKGAASTARYVAEGAEVTAESFGPGWQLGLFAMRRL